MKPLFKFCIPKILFLLLVTNAGIRPAAMAPAIIATEELAALAIVGVAAIHEVLARYGRCDKCKNKNLPVNIPEISVPMQNISVVGKSDEEVVAELTQVVTRIIGMKHNLSTADQSKLDSQLRSQKLTFINAIAHNRSLERTQREFASHRATIDQIKSSNREKGWILRNQAIDIFTRKNIIVRLPKNLPGFQKDIQTIKRIFVDCNNPDLVRRIEARIHLSYLVKLDPDLFGDIRKVACNLQARYFDKDKLVDISYDRRLAETMWMLFRDFPFYWSEKELKKFVGVIKRDNLDLEGGFERLYRRISFQLSAKERRQNKEYKPIAKLGKGKFFTHDRHKQILNESCNNELFRVAALCERGRFEEALSIANRFRSTIKSPMMNVIDHYHQKLCNKVGILKRYEYLPTWKQLSPSEKRAIFLNVTLQNQMNKRLQAEAIALSEAERKIAAESLSKDPISLAPDSDSPSTEQPISDIAPPPLPPDQDSDKNEKQEQDREHAKKKDSRPIPPEGENKFSDQKEKLKHNWDKREGHVEETPKNKKLIYDTANDSKCYFGPDKHKNHCYAKILKDGKQVWAEVRNNKITNWGINEPGNIRKWNPKTGFKALKAPSQKIPDPLSKI